MTPSSRRTYEICLGQRILTRREAVTPQHAVLDYLRSMGCQTGEIVRLSKHAVAWRGAVYTAVETPWPGNATGSQEADEAS